MNKDEIAKEFSKLEKNNLPVDTVVCGVCGNIVEKDNKDSVVCQHLTIKKWQK